jgi:RNA recognition motif-containing protein
MCWRGEQRHVVVRRVNSRAWSFCARAPWNMPTPQTRAGVLSHRDLLNLKVIADALLPPSMASSTTQPNTTLYVKNLNDKITKEELRSQLYALFSTYGKIIDVVAMKGPKMKGQAFLVFNELTAATSAMRALEGMEFYDKPLVSGYLLDDYYMLMVV